MTNLSNAAHSPETKYSRELNLYFLEELKELFKKYPEIGLTVIEGFIFIEGRQDNLGELEALGAKYALDKVDTATTLDDLIGTYKQMVEEYAVHVDKLEASDKEILDSISPS